MRFLFFLYLLILRQTTYSAFSMDVDSSAATDSAAPVSIGTSQTSVEDTLSTKKEITSVPNHKQGSISPNTGMIEKRDYDTIPELERILVRANKKQRLLEATESLILIKADEWTGTGKNLAEIIQEHSGIQTRKYGGVGSFQTVSIRGVQGCKVLVYLDGIPLNSAIGGAVDLGKINPNSIETIEVYKGITPAEFGGNSIGGIINLRSKSEKNRNAFDISSSIGTYGYMDHSLSIHHSIPENTKLFGSLSYLKSNNDYPYLDRNNTPYNYSDDVRRSVENNRYAAIEAIGRATLSIKNGQNVWGSISYASNRGGIPGDEGHINKTAQFEENITMVILNYDIELIEEKGLRISPELGFLYKEGVTTWTGLDDFGHSHGTIKQGEYGELGYENRKVHASCVLSSVPLDWFGCDAKLLGCWEDFDPVTMVGELPHGDWHSNQENLSLSTDLHIRFGPFGATVGGSGEVQRTETDGGTDYYYNNTLAPSDSIVFNKSGRIGLTLRPHKMFSVFTNCGKYYKTPTLREKYGTKGGVLPNPDLQTEDGLNYDGGFKWLLKRGYLELIAFSNTNKNSVIMLSDGKMVKPVNLGGSQSYGIEFNSTFKTFSFLLLEGHLTWQHTENQSRLWNYAGKRLPNEPEFSTIGKVTVGPFLSADIQYTLDYKSFFFRDPANIQRIPYQEDQYGICFHNARIRWKYQEKLVIIFSARNITDLLFRIDDVSQSYEDPYSWILYPGREFLFTISYSF